jgi:signal transduction histidine kinase
MSPSLLARSRRSIHVRLWLFLVAMSAVVLGGTLLVLGFNGWRLQRELYEQQMVDLARLVALNSTAPLEFDDMVTAAQDLALVASIEDVVYVGLYRVDGSLFAAEGACEDPPPGTGGRPEWPDVHYHADARICVTMPVERAGDVVGYVRVQKATEAMRQQAVLIVYSGLGIFAVAMMLAAGMSYRIGRSITGPVLSLAERVRRISATDVIELDSGSAGADEVGDLARGLDTMLQRLRDSRRRSEDTLAFQRTLFDTIPLPVYGKDTAGRFTAMNAMFARDLLGGDPAAMIGRMIEEASPSFDSACLAAWQRHERAVLNGDEVDPLEVECRLPVSGGDRPRWLRIYLGLYRDATGAVAGLMGVVQDMTEIRRMGRELIDISMREQQRLARDLHDNLGQLLTAAACKAKMVGHGVVTDSGTAAGLRAVIELVNRASREARAMSHGLNPVDVEQGGLVVALRELAASTEVYAKVTCRFVAKAGLAPLGKEVSNQLYRIAQEAVSNAVRHAGATEVVIQLQMWEGGVELTVSDNGQGMAGPGAEGGDHGNGMGLRIMRQRALLMQGSLRLLPAPGGGVQVVCRCPAGSREMIDD